MSPLVSSVALILRLDLRVRWREWRGQLSSGTLSAALFVLFYLILHAVSWPLVILSRDAHGSILETFGWLLVGFAAAMGSLTHLRFDRDDSALLLSSPVPVRAVLIARVLGQAAAGIAPVLFFATPFFNLAILLKGWNYLACYPTAVALAIVVSSATYAGALTLSRWIGAKRVIMLVRIGGALLGLFFALLAQLPQLLGKKQATALAGQFPPLNEWPLIAQLVRAGQGHGLDLALVLFVALGALALVGRTCANALLRGVQAHQETAPRPTRAGTHRWVESLAWATYRKEMRLMLRDPLIWVQLLSAIGPFLPIAFTSRGMGWAMAGMFACFTAQLGSATLVQVTTSRERCWELLRASPTPELHLRVAKLLAGLTIPVSLATLLCLGLAVIGRPSLAILALLTSGIGALAIGWMFACQVIPMPAANPRTIRPKLETGTFVKMLFTFAIVGPSLGGIAAAASGRVWLTVGLLGAAFLICALVVAFTQLREVEEWRLEALSSSAPASK